MNQKEQILDVCIVGDGFAGLNAARILSRKEKKTEIYSTGYGASQLWAGTFDFLNLDDGNQENLKTNMKKLENLEPLHPYRCLEFDELKEYFLDFSNEFPMIDFFIENGKFVNRNVLTLIGNLKPCLGIWNTIFDEFKNIKIKETVVLIDFIEFNNTSMYLVKKSLEEKFNIKIIILEISFSKLTKICLNEKENININTKLSEHKIGRFFDNDCNLKLFSNFIKQKLSQKFQNLDITQIGLFLFPPILGIDKNLETVNQLTTFLEKPCKELVALSPSLFSRRLEKNFKDILEERNLKINKGFTLVDIEHSTFRTRKIWILTFQKRNGTEIKIKANIIIIASGSLFSSGCFASENLIRDTLSKINIDISDQISQNYELIDTNLEGTNIYLCGSAIYLFNDKLTDEDEIKYLTGLGFAIATSHKVVNSLIDSR